MEGRPGFQRLLAEVGLNHVGLILGGAVGNLVCRLRYGRVVAFVYLHWGDWYWPAFNVADAAITIGVGVVLLESFRGRAETEIQASG